MSITKKLEQIVTEKYGVKADSPLTLENLFFRQLALAEGIDMLEEKYKRLYRRIKTLEDRGKNL